MAIEPITAAFELGGKIIDKVFPDKQAADNARIELAKMAESGELQRLSTSAGIVKAEAESDNVLTSSWRPIMMLTFGGLIVARWLGFAAPDITEAEYLKLWDIVELGIGGYVIGRSGEKIVPAVAQILKAK